MGNQEVPPVFEKKGAAQSCCKTGIRGSEFRSQKGVRKHGFPHDRELKTSVAHLWWGVSSSSGVAKTPPTRSLGSGNGDWSARSSASFRRRLTLDVISSSSSSVMPAC